MTTLARAIKAINSDASFTFKDDDLDTIQWNEGTAPISKTDILAKQTELQTQYDNNQYQRDRAVAYPSIKDQLDMQYWDKINSTTTWQDAIAKVKSDNPKG